MREILMLDGYPDTMTMDESDGYELWRSFNSMTKAYDFANKVGGQFYTQVDSDDSDDRVYAKGNHIVNRTGIWLVVKTTGDPKKDKELFDSEAWHVPEDMGDSQLDEEEEEDYLYRKQHGSELK